MYVIVGKIAAPYGLKGYVKAVPYSEIPERFLGVKIFYLDTDLGVRGYIVEDVRLSRKFSLIKFRHVDTREAARELVGRELLLPQEQQIELEDENTFFIHDLIGLQVFDNEGHELGVLEEVWEHTGNDVYVVRKNGKEILIPAVREFVKKVDLTRKQMIVQLIEGMIE
ncbi:MAG: 16S rRNA processing protein RimM [Calditrichaeota bacterium]|nr:MAG: 16S rRNA processing protein RimM [Calditrichota bacterium]